MPCCPGDAGYQDRGKMSPMIRVEVRASGGYVSQEAVGERFISICNDEKAVHDQEQKTGMAA